MSNRPASNEPTTAFQAKYSADQRAAIAYSAIDLHIGTRLRMCELAAAGQLVRPDGTLEPPFEIPVGSLTSIVQREGLKRVGRNVDPIASAEPRDAIEQMRVEYVTLCNTLLADAKAKAAKSLERVDLDSLSRIGDLILKASKMPGRYDTPRGKTAPRRTDTAATGPDRTELGAGILADAARNTARPRTRPEDLTDTEPYTGDDTPTNTALADARRLNGAQRDQHEPGSLAT